MCSEYALKLSKYFIFIQWLFSKTFRHSQPPFVHSKTRVCSGKQYFSTSVEKKIVGIRLNSLNDAVVTIIHNLFFVKYHNFSSEYCHLHIKVAVHCIGV